ncbi:MAG TPA: response regulator [Pyrinomonadaceae bacterium]|jgi:DNA-binding response OmpR family regulator|nr:response regulator [Pyrinomonadaceae bacterium]
MRLTPNILFVEDDADTQELVAILLRLENYHVVLAKDSDEALLLARAMRFALYILDNWIPGGPGIELCKKLREFDATTPIVFYSGAAYDSDKRAAFAAGAQEYLIKPTHNDTLIETVARLIAEAGKLKPTARAVTRDAVEHKPLASVA